MTRRASRRIALVFAVLLAAAPTIAAQSPPRTAPIRQGAQNDVTVYLLTMGVGTQIWELFGHDALWFHDPRAGTKPLLRLCASRLSSASHIAGSP